MRVTRIELPELHAAQWHIMRTCRRFNVLNCGRRFGKSTIERELAVNALLDGQAVGYWEPTYKMLSQVWRGLVELLQPITVSKSEQEHRLEVVTGGVLDMWSLETADTARGRRYALALIDEAAQDAQLLGHWEQVIRPTLIDLQGKAWFASTPNGRNGFFRLHLLGRDDLQPEWMSWTYTSYDNPLIPPGELDALRTTMSEQAYKQEIMAEFLEADGAVFRRVHAACRALVGDTPDAHYGHVLVAGVDWGKQGDFTALSIGCAHCRREVYLDRFNEIDYAFQTQRIREALSRWNVAACKVELNSIGTPLFEQLQRMGLPVNGFTTTAQTKRPLIEGLALSIESGRILLLPDPVAMAEMESYTQHVNPQTGHSSYSAPEGMHDDTVIARALMVEQMDAAPVVYVNPTRRKVSNPLAGVFK